ncbi:MAG TPA: PadR family transcriptional regulator [Gemmatimonadales bacterium]|nr:PadR family transcriptional regulator [Gemmatimonadales bacterium]
MSAPDFVPLGVLEEHILIAVFRTGDEAYGMQVRREIEQVTGRDLAIGAVYSTLDRLEEKGLLSSRRGLDGGPSRRRFSLSPAGARALAATRAMRDRLWDGVPLQRLLHLAR